MFGSVKFRQVQVCFLIIFGQKKTKVFLLLSEKN